MWRRLVDALGPMTAHNFLVDASAAGLFAIFSALTMPFIAVIAVRRGATPLEVGILAAIPWVAMLLSSWYAKLPLRWPRVRIVTWSGILSRLALLVAAWTHDIGLYSLSYLAYNLFGAASNPAYTSLERAIYHQKWRGRLMAGVRGTLGFFQFAATLAAGPLLDHFGAGRVFTLAILFGLASALVFSRMRDPGRIPRPAGGPRGGLHLVTQDPRLRRLLWAVTLAGGGNLLVQVGFPIFQVHRLHLSDTGIALLTAVWALAWTVSYPLWGRVCDRGRSGLAIRIALTLYCIPTLCYAASHGIGLLFVGAIAQGLGDAALDCGWQNHCMRLAGEDIDGYAGVYFTFMGMRGTVAPLVGALVIAHFGLRPLFLAGLLPVVAGSLIAARLPDGPLAAAAGPSTGRPLPS